MMLRLMDLFLARLARTGASMPPLAEASEGELSLLRRLAPSHHAGRAWAELQQTLGARARHGKSVNLDPAALILDMVLKIDETAARVAAR
ncbi:MAG TPA: DNA polymerase III subunit delta', partial [Paracoccaceae bacterium]|nr:DNA polymerase III subunit delta' [Paracoccaceae bacterium]